MNNDPKNKRNVAIIAHVDHGKTTIVDAILKQSNVFRSNEEEMQKTQILDSGDLEREKGITISAKNISVDYKGTRINIIDTPGHADFGGEVERTLNMADGCILVVDAQEGPMIQTKVVLRKALSLGLKPIVVINKIDKKNADTKRTISKIQDLFLELASSEEQLDFPVLYAIAKEGKVFDHFPEGDLTTPNSTTGDITPLLDAIVKFIAPPSGNVDMPFQMQVCSLEFDSFNGRYLIGRINRGKLTLDQSVVLVQGDKESQPIAKGRIKKIFIREGLKFQEVKDANVGDIIAIVGIESTAIGATLCDASNPDPLPTLDISPPSIEVKVEPNTSPFVGKDGEFVTARLLKRRLDKENETNVSIDITTSEEGSNTVRVRGELQLSILLETLRREGFELQVRKPTIVYKKIDGVLMEPMEELTIEVPAELANVIIPELTQREAQLIDMENRDDKSNFEYKILTRNLFGLRQTLVTQTKGRLVFNSVFSEYVPYKEIKKLYRKGAIISSAQGTTKEYALNTIQERGKLFVKASEEVYEGMIIGINKFDEDIEVNPARERKKSGVRRNQAEITITALRAPMELTLDSALMLIGSDEMLEITPHNLRLRKIYLTHVEREWAKRKKLTDYAKKQLKS